MHEQTNQCAWFLTKQKPGVSDRAIGMRIIVSLLLQDTAAICSKFNYEQSGIENDFTLPNLHLHED